MSKRRVPPSVPAKPDLRRELRDPVNAAELLNAAAAEDDPADFLYALRKVAEAYGGIAGIARRAGLNRQQLYRTLSRKGNPELRTFMAILRAAGYMLHVTPKELRKGAKSRPPVTRIRQAGARPTAARRTAEPGVTRQS